mgnify:CR=1 FL=1
MITGELKNKIDALWDIFAAGGLVNPLEVIEQITYLMFIHDLDEADNTRAKESAMLGLPYQSIFSEEVKIGERTISGNQLKWSVFHDFPADRMYSVMQEWVFPFIKTLHSDKNSAYSKYMDDAIFKLPTPLVLSKVVDSLDEIYAVMNEIQTTDVRGDVYEYLLSKIAQSGRNGQFRTPRHIIRMMVELMDPSSDEIICDPACGTSGFLVVAGEYLKEKKKIKKSKIYQEKYLEIMGKIECSEDKLQVLFENENELIEILDFYHRPVGSRRAVDFNQGMDARQLTDEKMRILSRIPIEPFRLAFDSIKYKTIYSDALKIAAKYGVSSFSNYILYNCDDKPEELWERLKVNVDLAKELKVKIFSFPMKYAPINRTDRKFVGKFWNKKYLKNIYAILNVTKGIVADGESFFFKAFGRNVEEFYVILSMPKEFVTYRNYFEENGLAAEWRDKFLQLSIEEKNELLQVLSEERTTQNSRLIELLGYYSIRKETE